MIGLVAAFLVSLLPFQQAHAGLFSFFGALFESDNSSADYALGAVLLTSLNTMPILEAPVNPEIAKLAQGGADLTIVNNNALVPVSGPLGSVSEGEDSIQTDRITLYTVREGDNISVIAQMFGVNVNTILWANEIGNSGLIKPGDVLVILPVSGIKHVVARGDTLSSITDTYKGDFDEILAFNGLNVDSPIQIGDEIVIPGGEMPAISSSRSSGTRVVVSSGGVLKDAAGYYIRPVSGVRSQGLHGYNAVDLAASCGAPIYATADGTVIVSKGYGWNGGYGSYVVVTHANGTQTLYAHNTANWVSAGQYVTQGQAIGSVGSTGRSTGCHVHFEVRGAKNPF